MPSRLRIGLLVLVVAASLVPSSAAIAAAPSYTMEERAAAIASPALVYIEARTQGFMRSRVTGQLMHPEPITLVNRCSGFAVESAGHVISTTRCVRPTADALHSSAVSILAGRMVRATTVPEADEDKYREELLKTLTTEAAFTVQDGDATPETKIYGQIFRGWGGLTAAPALTGQVLQSRSSETGDIALVKFDFPNMSVAELGGTDLDVEATGVLVGFGTTDKDLSSATFTVRSRPARVIGRIGNSDPPLFRLDEEIGDVSHGGILVDASGRVVGMINDDTTTSSRDNRAAVGMAQIKELLNAAGVTNTLTARDQSYRAGLDAYFAGRYNEAIDRLDAVIEAVPGHTVAQTYRRNAAERLAVEGGGGRSMPGWAIALIVVLSVVVIALIALLVMIFLRRRQPQQPRVPIAALPYAPVSGIPVSAMPVSGSGYQDYYQQGYQGYQNPWQPGVFADPLALPSQAPPPHSAPPAPPDPYANPHWSPPDQTNPPSGQDR